MSKIVGRKMTRFDYNWRKILGVLGFNCKILLLTIFDIKNDIFLGNFQTQCKLQTSPFEMSFS